MFKIFLSFTIIFIISIKLFAATLRLNSGESLEGKIKKMDEKSLFLESNLTAQELKIERENLSLIEFDASERSLARRFGIGFHYRPNGDEETISVKNWLSPADSAGLMVGYKAGTVESFSVEIRYARVFKIEGTNDLFYGAGTGIVSNESKKDTMLRFFSGTEFFPQTSPNFGITLEFGIFKQASLQTFYNALSAHYYF
tara:strand:- start:913 stop:1509 length:597 start_codon:yes stop_codon:yes gene_type:complete